MNTDENNILKESLSFEREKIQLERERLELERERLETERTRHRQTVELSNRAAGRIVLPASTFTLSIVLAYIALLFVVSYLSGCAKHSATQKKHPRWLVTLAMVGAAITGITFVSVPGSVGEDAFSYLQMGLGFIVAYIVIAY